MHEDQFNIDAAECIGDDIKFTAVFPKIPWVHFI